MTKSEWTNWPILQPHFDHLWLIYIILSQLSEIWKKCLLMNSHEQRSKEVVNFESFRPQQFSTVQDPFCYLFVASSRSRCWWLPHMYLFKYRISEKWVKSRETELLGVIAQTICTFLHIFIGIQRRHEITIRRSINVAHKISVSEFSCLLTSYDLRQRLRVMLLNNI